MNQKARVGGRPFLAGDQRGAVGATARHGETAVSQVPLSHERRAALPRLHQRGQSRRTLAPAPCSWRRRRLRRQQLRPS